MTSIPNSPVAKELSSRQPDMSESSVPSTDTRTLIILAFSATAGVLVEFYDFAIFGFAVATAFPEIFFPKLPPTQALVFSYLAYAAGHPARLLGAFIFGHFGDRSGRKFAFLINIVVVGASTCLTGLLPGYATIGTRDSEPTGGLGERVSRGGSFLCSARFCEGYRASARNHATPDTSLENIGFRCAAEPEHVTDLAGRIVPIVQQAIFVSGKQSAQGGNAK